MKRIIQCSVITLLPLIVGIAAYAEEGFFLKHTLPSQLIPAWEATFFIEYHNGESATAFVIDKQIVTSRRSIRMGRPPFPVSARPAAGAQAAMKRPPRRASSSGHSAVSPYERGREST